MTKLLILNSGTKKIWNSFCCVKGERMFLLVYKAAMGKLNKKSLFSIYSWAIDLIVFYMLLIKQEIHFIGDWPYHFLSSVILKNNHNLKPFP